MALKASKDKSQFERSSLETYDNNIGDDNNVINSKNSQKKRILLFFFHFHKNISISIYIFEIRAI